MCTLRCIFIRWKDSTLENSYQCIKTAWPVPIIEALFLPEFKIDFTKKHEFEVNIYLNILGKRTSFIDL